MDDPGHAHDGSPYENDYAFVFEVREGRISAVREYFDTARRIASALRLRVMFSDPGAACVPAG